MTHETRGFYTPTMARLYAEQGYLRKAAAIYAELAARQPDRQDLIEALRAVEARIRAQTHPPVKELGLMMRDWVRWIEEYKKHKKEAETAKGDDHGRQDNTT